MKKLKFGVALVALLVAVVGCSKTDDKSAEIAALEDKIRKIEKENEELKNLNGETGLVGSEPTAEYTDTFLRNFCKYVAADNPKELMKDAVEDQNYLDYYVRIIDNIKQEFDNCDYEQAMFYDHPFDVAEYKTNKGYMYVQAAYSPEFKVRRFVPLVFDYRVDMSLHNIDTKDGKKLTTWKIQRTDGSAKKGAIFHRTPYMIYGGVIAQAYLALYFDKMLVLQANRGSHNSTGDFKWLDPINIEDSRDSMDWIVQQPRSNGRIMAYGVSYDGYDALASAVTNHPALKSVVACSAPANAATDSFTSSKFVENGIFSYVTTDRRSGTAGDASSYWEFIKTDATSLGRSRMDDVLLGFDFDEWNITSQAVDDKDHAYWQERQLMDDLLEAKMPIAHVAGLVRDQDGRDTLLAFDHINEKSKYKDLSFLVLHKDGHGCGDFWAQVPLSRKLMGLIEDGGTFDPASEKRWARYTKQKNGYTFADAESELPIDQMVVDFPETFKIEDFALQSMKDPNLFSNSMALTFEEEVVINGAPIMKLATKANVPEVPVHVNFFFIGPDGQGIEGAYGWRTAAITNKVDQEEMTELTFHLINAVIPKGSQMLIEITTRNERVFLRQPASKTGQILTDEPAGVEILSEEGFKTELFLPIERVEKVEETPEEVNEEEATEEVA